MLLIGKFQWWLCWGVHTKNVGTFFAFIFLNVAEFLTFSMPQTGLVFAKPRRPRMFKDYPLSVQLNLNNWKKPNALQTIMCILVWTLSGCKSNRFVVNCSFSLLNIEHLHDELRIEGWHFAENEIKPRVQSVCRYFFPISLLEFTIELWSKNLIMKFVESTLIITVFYTFVGSWVISVSHLANVINQGSYYE